MIAAAAAPVAAGVGSGSWEMLKASAGPQERVFAAIDGKRTVEEILRGAAGTAGLDQGREFIERLWRYDQIVFDATGSR